MDMSGIEHTIFPITCLGVFCSSNSQQTFTCSKSTMETLEKTVKYVLRRHYNDGNDVGAVLVSFEHDYAFF